MIAAPHFPDSTKPVSAFEIVMSILWLRLGTPQPAKAAVREYGSRNGSTLLVGLWVNA